MINKGQEEKVLPPDGTLTTQSNKALMFFRMFLLYGAKVKA